MLAAPRRANVALEYVRLLSTLITLNSALPWITFPLLVAAGQAPPHDDVLNTLGIPGAPPLVVGGVRRALHGGLGALPGADRGRAPRDQPLHGQG